MRKRRQFTPEFKARLVLDILTGVQLQAEASRKPGLGCGKFSWRDLRGLGTGREYLPDIASEGGSGWLGRRSSDAPVQPALWDSSVPKSGQPGAAVPQPGWFPARFANRPRQPCDGLAKPGSYFGPDPKPRERDHLVVIPGLDHSRVVIMADHYDTAYMEDRYRRNGVRLAAPGADDNTSATAALLMAAPVLLEMSRQGRLSCDVWLVHLTGEEFPADSLGARHLAARLMANDLKLRLSGRRGRDLTGVRVEGIFVLDMVAHENPRRRGVFQIAPGVGAGALRMALETHQAVEAWNALATGWDRHPARRAAQPYRRGRPGLPPIARHARMIGEVRPHDDPRSTLYNTDAQIFSDAGFPTVLLMEDYDINRHGYHDSQDTMAGIDLPYGAALAAIAIEAVARVAARPSHVP